MRQYTLGTLIDEIFDIEYNYICRLELMIQDAEASNPPYGSTLANGIPIQLHDLSGTERVSRANLYEKNVTQECFLKTHPDVNVGCKLILTHRILENGTNFSLPEKDREEFLICGIIKIFGLPAPVDQIQLDLSQITPMKG